VLGGGFPTTLSRVLFGLGGRLAFVMMAQKPHGWVRGRGLGEPTK
jgi:hypothetical protein